MKKNHRYVQLGNGRTGVKLHEEKQANMALNEERVLVDTTALMERICEPSNLNRAFRKVKRNKGSAGVDRKTIAETEKLLRSSDQAQQLRESLLAGEYQPQLVKGVIIPKPDGGERQLGIPTVMDRWIQQAIAQVLQPIFDPGFSGSSFGFRPGRSAHDALRQASDYVKSGRCWVVDLDLEKYFDTVNHDRLMHRISEGIDDKRVLKLIRQYLQAGLLQNGVIMTRQKGTPQGGPLSPLLANIVLDEWDKELEKRGHMFCRYADDCQIYMHSQQAGERVLQSVMEFLERKLRLTVNIRKSACAKVEERQFLGYRIQLNGNLSIAPKSLQRMRKRVRELTYRNRGRALDKVIEELNRYLHGWLNYFRHAKARSQLGKIDSWIRRRLRCYRLKQRKRRWSIA